MTRHDADFTMNIVVITHVNSRTQIDEDKYIEYYENHCAYEECHFSVITG